MQLFHHTISLFSGQLQKLKLAIGFFVLLTVFSTNNAIGQVSGDYGAVSSGTWSTASIWKIYNGVSWVSSPVAATAPNSSAINVFITPGAIVTLTVSQTTCNNLTINSTGQLYTNSGASNVYIYVYGNITNNGVIGNGATFDAISFGIEGANCLFTGTGTVDISRLRKNLSVITTTNLIIDININLRFATGSQTQIYNSANSATFNVTVNAGKTVNLTGSAGNVGNVAMDGIAGNDASERGGSYTINGTMIITGTLYLTTNNSSLPCSFTIGSTGIVQTTSVIANASGVATHALTMFNGGLLQITGTPFTNPFTLVNNNYTLFAGSTIEYSAPGVQTVDNNLNYANLKISGTGNKTGAGPIYVTGNLTMVNSAIFVPNPVNPLVYVGGDWTDYSAAGFAETGSTVTLNGGTNQNIICTGGESYNNLIVNKAGGKAITSTAPSTIVRVAGTLNLLSGNILTTSSSYVLIQTSGVVINVNDNSFVEGVCAKQGTTAFTFPVGKIAKYRPIGMSAPPSAATIFLAEYFKIDPQAIPTVVTAKDPTIDHVSRCEYWMMRSSVATPLTLTLSWDTYSCGVSSLPDLLVTAWNGSLWKDQGNSATTGTLAKGTVTASSTYSISATNTPLTLASFTPFNPLPVKLLSFTARPEQENVQLNWVTGTEINNDHFDIERSHDGVEFEFVERVRGYGNSSQPRTYTAIDPFPYKGVSYYRLKQVDFDGKTAYSETVPVNLSSQAILTLFPNPASEKVFVLKPEGFEKEQFQAIVTNLAGQQVLQIMLSSETISEVSILELPPGVYNISVLGTYSTSFHSFFVKQ